LAIYRRPRAIVGSFRAISRGACAVSLGPEKDVFATRTEPFFEVMQFGQVIPAVTAAVTERRRPIAILPGLQPQPRHVVTECRDRGAVTARMFPRARALVVVQLISTCGEIIISSVLILIRGSLIAVTRRLILVRPSLILIARGLIAITRRLILIRRRLIAIARRLILAASRETRRWTGEVGPACHADRPRTDRIHDAAPSLGYELITKDRSITPTEC
jgi:hypothetical protein